MKALLVSAILVLGPLAAAWAADGNPARGQRAFGACAACHSLEPDKSMTGPSLSGLWNRKAGDLVSFARFSDAVKSSGVVWNDKTLDAWITDPQHLIPGNQMTFAGIKDSQQRADLLVFLKDATQPGRAPASAQRGAPMGMMRGTAAPNLKKLNPEDRVQAISYCRDGYRPRPTARRMSFGSETSGSRPTAAATVPRRAPPPWSQPA